MTNEETIKILEYEKNKLIWDGVDKDYYGASAVEAINNAISALQKLENNRLHELRKNHEDLPEIGTHIVYLFKCVEHGRSILGSNACYYGRHLLDDWGAYKYIACKECGFEEIEPFEE